MIGIGCKQSGSYEEFKFLSGWCMGLSSPLPEGWEEGAFIRGNEIGKPNDYTFITTDSFTFICEYQHIESDMCWGEDDLEFLVAAASKLENMNDDEDDY